MSRTIELLINGEPRTLTVLPHQTLLEALRNAGLTGTKRGCDKGDCGACSVLVDNKPTLSCSTLVMSVQGKRIETVEGALSDPHGRALHNALGRT
ncbi:TPA: hypothetical protein DCZ32_00140, partial [Candidatus Uhrbacteria bacterium]|nr:hypothetical protein [Candidatus Uhrbacteria bacterium]